MRINVSNCLLEYLSAMIYDCISIFMLLLTDLLENSFDELVIHGKSCVYDLSSYFSRNTSKQHFTTLFVSFYPISYLELSWASVCRLLVFQSFMLNFDFKNVSPCWKDDFKDNGSHHHSMSSKMQFDPLALMSLPCEGLKH